MMARSFPLSWLLGLVCTVAVTALTALSAHAEATPGDHDGASSSWPKTYRGTPNAVAIVDMLGSVWFRTDEWEPVPDMSVRVRAGRRSILIITFSASCFMTEDSQQASVMQVAAKVNGEFTRLFAPFFCGSGIRRSGRGEAHSFTWVYPVTRRGVYDVSVAARIFDRTDAVGSLSDRVLRVDFERP